MQCLYEFPSFNFFADDEKAIPVYEPSEIPEDPNRIKDTDCEVVKLVKELLDTYPLFFDSILSFISRAFVHV